MKKFNNVMIFLVAFMLFFMLGIVFSCILPTIKYIDLFFDSDSIRVLSDLTIILDNHYRTTVHPLYVILFQPLTLLMRVLFTDTMLTTLVLQSLLSAGTILLMKLSLDKIKINKKIKVLLLLIFSFSFSQLIFNSTLETYSFAQFFLIFLFYWCLKVKDKSLNKLDFIVLISLGIYNLGITITNYFIYILAIIYLVFLRKNKDKSKGKNIQIFLLLIIVPVFISIILSLLQYLLFPESKLFFVDNVIHFFNGTSEEYHFMSRFNLQSVINQIKSVFCYGFLAPNINVVEGEYLKLQFGEFFIFQICLLFILGVFLLGCLVNYFKNKKDRKDGYFILILISFLFNFTLHLIYGNDIGFLYTLHYQFVFILLIAFLLKNVKDKYLKFSIVLLSVFFIFELLFNIYALFDIFSKLLNYMRISNINYFNIIIAFITVICVILCCLKISKKNKVLLIIFVILLNIIFKVFFYNSNSYDNRFYYNKDYIESYDLYLNQLDMLYDELDVNVSFNNSEKIMFFGMGDRKKILYKDGVLYDIKNNYEIIKEYDVDKEMIIPNEYIVNLLTKDGREILIYENKYGIFINDNNSIDIIDESSSVNLLEFDGQKYSEVLKVLHQEILFNIYNSELIPNILVYDNAWYRDAMMASMVLEKTDNLDLISEWVKSIDKIYDEQNGNKEVDNLGELLYILEVTKSDNDIKNNIYEEVSRITKNKSIAGIIDGSYKNYYPTAILLYALEQGDKSLDIQLPKYDGYSELVWYYDVNKKIKSSIDSKDFPYLGWANYHTNKKGILYNCDKLYPLSYERTASKANYDVMSDVLVFYKKRRISPTHLWDASEKFLLLYE